MKTSAVLLCLLLQGCFLPTYKDFMKVDPPYGQPYFYPNCNSCYQHGLQPWQSGIPVTKGRR